MGWEYLTEELKKYVTQLRKDLNINLSIFWSYFTAYIYGICNSFEQQWYYQSMCFI